MFLIACGKKYRRTFGIEVIENKKFAFFPSVKCNIGKGGEKIYHLPFDQRYDSIKIEPEKGEFYCATIEEAERGISQSVQMEGLSWYRKMRKRCV